MAAAIGDRAAFPVHTMYTTGRSTIAAPVFRRHSG